MNGKNSFGAVRVEVRVAEYPKNKVLPAKKNTKRTIRLLNGNPGCPGPFASMIVIPHWADIEIQNEYPNPNSDVKLISIAPKVMVKMMANQSLQ